uniref:Uncharacterized protein n=1 Tax=Oryza nivara TaxID=4536 RepID=A0A679BDE8_ORYNI|nr:hypothetical protein [Oryza sativa f. spontanea]
MFEEEDCPTVDYVLEIYAAKPTPTRLVAFERSKDNYTWSKADGGSHPLTISLSAFGWSRYDYTWSLTSGRSGPHTTFMSCRGMTTLGPRPAVLEVLPPHLRVVERSSHHIYGWSWYGYTWSSISSRSGPPTTFTSGRGMTTPGPRPAVVAVLPTHLLVVKEETGHANVDMPIDTNMRDKPRDTQSKATEADMRDLGRYPQSRQVHVRGRRLPYRRLRVGDPCHQADAD